MQADYGPCNCRFIFSVSVCFAWLRAGGSARQITHREGDEMQKFALMLAGVALAALVGANPAMAQKKTLAVVVKGLDNPFFTVLGDGCALWNKENPTSEYTCLYTGPASTTDE